MTLARARSTSRCRSLATDVEKQFQESLGEMTKEAVLPGFRTGPRPQATGREAVSASKSPARSRRPCLMASLEQLDEEYKINPITQPELDIEAIELPDCRADGVRDGRRGPPRFPPAGLQGAHDQEPGPD